MDQVPDTIGESSTREADLSALPAGTYSFRVRARSSFGVWSPAAELVVDIPTREDLSPPMSLTAGTISATAAELSWTRASFQESGFEVQRRVIPNEAPFIFPAPTPQNGVWTWTPGVEGLYEIAARTTRTPNGETRAPYTLPNGTLVRVNQSNHGPAELEWEFQDANNGATLTQVDQSGTRTISNWTAGISGSTVSEGHLRIRSAVETLSYAGGTSLGYSSGLVVLEADFDGWNVVGTVTQSFQLSLNTGVGSEVSAGIILQQDASGLQFYGRALGSGTSTPSHTFPNMQTGPITLRVRIDFSGNTLTASYRAPDTNGLFVTVGSGTLDPARNGATLRLRMSGDWSGSGEFIDLSRIRILPAPPAAADAAEWVTLGVQPLQATSQVQLGSQGTRAPVVADELRFTAVGVWETVAMLPSGATSWSDSALSPATAYEYRVRALGESTPGAWSETLAVNTPEDPYVLWTSTVDWDGTDSAPGADADLDGVSNLLEYALAGDPMDEKDSPRSSVLSAADTLGLSFVRARAELTYIIEGTDDLRGTWSELARNPGAAGESVSVFVPTDDSPQLFLRVRVE